MGVVFEACAVTPEVYSRLIAGEVESKDPVWRVLPERETLSLGKNWAVLFRFLNFGSDEAYPTRVAMAVCGGEPINLGSTYSSPRALSPSLVAGIVADLNGSGEDVSEDSFDYFEGLDEAEILRRHRFVDQKGAYSEGSGPEQVVADFRGLRDFYRRAAAAGDGVVTWLC